MRHFHAGRRLICEVTCSISSSEREILSSCIEEIASGVVVRRALLTERIIQSRYPVNIIRKRIPSIRPSVIPRYPSSSKSPAQKIDNGNSFCKVLFWTASGTNKVQTPHTTSRLKILEPTALLMARELLPVREAVTLTAHSGRLVPMATMVMPMIMEGIRSRFATAELPSTKKSAPLINRTNPTINIMNDFNNCMWFSFFPFLNRY